MTAESAVPKAKGGHRPHHPQRPPITPKLIPAEDFAVSWLADGRSCADGPANSLKSNCGRCGGKSPAMFLSRDEDNCFRRGPTCYSQPEKIQGHGYLQFVLKTLCTVDRYFVCPRSILGVIFFGAVMYSNQQHISSSEVVELRKEAGLWLKELREKRGLSQRQMAEKVGGNYYTFISQLEVRSRPNTPRSIFGMGRRFGRGAEVFRQKSPKEL